MARTLAVEYDCGSKYSFALPLPRDSHRLAPKAEARIIEDLAKIIDNRHARECDICTQEAVVA
jgi:hypothetical protein